jgi:SnoaL-like domain
VADLTKTVDTYIAIWNETGDDRRRELAQKVWARDGRYVDPFADAKGADELASFIGAVQAQFPEHTLRRTSGIDVHHDQVRFAWELAAADGTVAAAGIDVCELDEHGKLSRISGFVGELPPVEAPVAA